MIGFAVVLKQLCQIAFTINRRILQEWHEIVLSNDSTPFKDFNTFVSYVQPSVWRYPSETCDKKPSLSGFRIVNLNNCTDGDIRTNIKSATFYTVPHSLSRLCEIASDFPLERNIINDVIIMKEKRLQMKKKRKKKKLLERKKKKEKNLKEYKKL